MYIMETLRKHFSFEGRAIYLLISHLFPKEVLDLPGQQGAKYYTLSVTGLDGMVDYPY